MVNQGGGLFILLIFFVVIVNIRKELDTVPRAVLHTGSGPFAKGSAQKLHLYMTPRPAS